MEVEHLPDVPAIVEAILNDLDFSQKWKHLYTALGLDDSVLTLLELRLHHKAIRFHDIFLVGINTWLKNSGNRGTIGNLQIILKNAGLFAAADQIMYDVLHKRLIKAVPTLINSYVEQKVNYQTLQLTAEIQSDLLISNHPILFEIGSLDSEFVGRDNEITQIKNIFLQEDINIAVICGDSGVGKTGLAKRLISTFLQHDTCNSFWLNGTNFHEFKNSIIRLARYLNIANTGRISDILDDIIEKLHTSNIRTIIIIDDLKEECDAFVQEIQEKIKTNKIFIIITSERTQELHFRYYEIKLSHLSIDEIKCSLRRGVPFCPNSNFNLLAETVGNFYLPLKLATVFTWVSCQLNKPSYDIDYYIESYIAQRLRIFPAGKVPLTHKDVVFLTCTLSMEKIEATGSYGRLAIQLLQYMSLFCSENIPIDLLRKLVSQKENQDLFRPTILDHFNLTLFDRALILLKLYSLIQIDNYVISIHKLIQATILNNMEIFKMNKIFKSIVNVVESCDPNEIIHIISATQKFQWYDNEKLIRELPTFPYNILNKLRDLHMFPEMLTVSSEAFSLFRKSFGDEKLPTLIIERKMAEALLCNGLVEEGTNTYLGIYSKMIVDFGPDFSETVITAINICRIYRTQKNFPEALKYLELALVSNSYCEKGPNNSVQELIADIRTADTESSKAINILGDDCNPLSNSTFLSTVSTISHCLINMGETFHAKNLLKTFSSSNIKLPQRSLDNRNAIVASLEKLKLTSLPDDSIFGDSSKINSENKPIEVVIYPLSKEIFQFGSKTTQDVGALKTETSKMEKSREPNSRITSLSLDKGSEKLVTGFKTPPVTNKRRESCKKLDQASCVSYTGPQISNFIGVEVTPSVIDKLEDSADKDVCNKVDTFLHTLLQQMCRSEIHRKTIFIFLVLIAFFIDSQLKCPQIFLIEYFISLYKNDQTEQSNTTTRHLGFNDNPLLTNIAERILKQSFNSGLLIKTAGSSPLVKFSGPKVQPILKKYLEYSGLHERFGIQLWNIDDMKDTHTLILGWLFERNIRTVWTEFGSNTRLSSNPIFQEHFNYFTSQVIQQDALMKKFKAHFMYIPFPFDAKTLQQLQPRSLLLFGETDSLTIKVRKLLDAKMHDQYEAFKAELGQVHWKTLAAGVRAAQRFFDSGMKAEGLAVRADLAENCICKLGRKDRRTLTKICDLGQALELIDAPSENEKALNLYEQILPFCEEVLGPDDPYTIVVSNGIMKLKEGNGLINNIKTASN